MSTMTKAGIPVDTLFVKRQHEYAERKARQVAFNNKVREFHATDRGVKVTQKKTILYAEMYNKRLHSWIVTPYEQLSELAEYEEQGYKQVRAWSEKIEIEV